MREAGAHKTLAQRAAHHHTNTKAMRQARACKTLVQRIAHAIQTELVLDSEPRTNALGNKQTGCDQQHKVTMALLTPVSKGEKENDPDSDNDFKPLKKHQK